MMVKEEAGSSKEDNEIGSSRRKSDLKWPVWEIVEGGDIDQWEGCLLALFWD